MSLWLCAHWPLVWLHCEWINVLKLLPLSSVVHGSSETDLGRIWRTKMQLGSLPVTRGVARLTWTGINEISHRWNKDYEREKHFNSGIKFNHSCFLLIFTIFLKLNLNLLFSFFFFWPLGVSATEIVLYLVQALDWGIAYASFPLVPSQLDSTLLGLCCFPLWLSDHLSAPGSLQPKVLWCLCLQNKCNGTMEDVWVFVSRWPWCRSLCSRFYRCRISKWAVLIFGNKPLSWLIEWHHRWVSCWLAVCWSHIFRSTRITCDSSRASTKKEPGTRDCYLIGNTNK